MMTYARVSAIALFTTLLFGVQYLSYSCNKREPTHETGPGPHDYSAGVADSKLWRKGDAGEPMILRARVLDTCGNPIAGARIQILHANQDGEHEPDRWRADLLTNDRGVFKLLTVYPGYTGGIARHMHFNITHPAYQQLFTRLSDLDSRITELMTLRDDMSKYRDHVDARIGSLERAAHKEEGQS